MKLVQVADVAAILKFIREKRKLKVVKSHLDRAKHIIISSV